MLHLLLVLPDGSRSLVPAAWTDLEGAGADDGDGVLARLSAGMCRSRGSPSSFTHRRLNPLPKRHPAKRGSTLAGLLTPRSPNTPPPSPRYVRSLTRSNTAWSKSA